jgi:hypothetical protein
LAAPRNWCGRRDLHPQRACAHRRLGPARLLVSPHPRKLLRKWITARRETSNGFRRSPRQSRRTVESGRSGENRTHVVSVPNRVPGTARLRSEKENYTAAQVARRRKTSPASALSDRRSGKRPRTTLRHPRRKWIKIAPRGRHRRFTPSWRTARSSITDSIAKKNTHRRPFRRHRVGRFGRPQDFTRALADCLWAQR